MNNKPHINLCTIDGHLGSFQHLATASNAVVTVLLPVSGIHMYAFLMGVYKEVRLLGHGCVCSPLRATDKDILSPFLEYNNYIGSSLLLADECNITFHHHFSPRRLRRESDQDSQSVSTWLCPVCSW